MVDDPARAAPRLPPPPPAPPALPLPAGAPPSIPPPRASRPASSPEPYAVVASPRPAGPPPPAYGPAFPSPSPTQPRTSRWWVAALAAVVAVVSGVVLAATEPGLTAPVVALHATSGIVDAPQGWAPEFTDDKGRPARWDPCLPIHYVVDSRYAPPGGLADVHEAIGQVSKATGMTFVDDGGTLELPQRAREAYQPGHYGRHWAPVLIAWAPPSATDLLTDPDAEGVTVPIAVPTSSGGVIVTAEVVLNTARALPPGFGRGGSEGEVLLHELGHVVGLAHVSDPAQAMYPMARGLAAYGEGDLAGLTALGRSAGCLPEPAPHHLTTSSTPTG